MSLYAAGTHFHPPPSPFCSAFHSGCEISELFAFLSSMNIVFAMLQITWRCWNTVADVTEGDVNWKKQLNLY